MSTYETPGASYLRDRATYLLKALVIFINMHRKDFITETKVNRDAFSECISRVHQRQHYFEVFHDMKDGVSEIKRISLYCFWILKYRPFVFSFDDAISDFEDQKFKKMYFLERFCIFLLSLQIRSLYKITRLPLSNDGIRDIVYSLRHHDISKEALTAMFEMLEDVSKQNTLK